MKRFIETFSVVFAIGVLILLIVLLFVRGKNEAKNDTQSLQYLEQQIVQEDPVFIPEEENDTDVEAPIVFVESVEGFQEDEDSLSNPDIVPAETQDATIAPIELQRVTKYYNKPLEYGFLIPYGNYYSGFGQQNWALHSVGMSFEGVPETFTDAEVQVLYYGTTEEPIPQDAEIKWDQTGTIAYILPDTDTIYIRILEEYEVQLIGDIDTETVQAIIQTIFVGVNTEEVTDNEE